MQTTLPRASEATVTLICQDHKEHHRHGTPWSAPSSSPDCPGCTYNLLFQLQYGLAIPRNFLNGLATSWHLLYGLAIPRKFL